MKRKRDIRFAKLVVILNGIVPGAVLAWDAAHHQLGVNGVNYALHTTGLLALIFLLLSLIITPVRKLTGWSQVIAFRRSLGLYAFFYVCTHFAIFFVLDRGFSVSSTLHEILTRRYLQIGTAGLLLMVPLAATSTNAMVMRLGAKRWKALHRIVYVVAIAGALHYTLLVKSDVRQPLAFAGVLAALLGFRLVRAILDRRTTRPASTPVAARSPAPPSKPRYWSGELRVARVFDETPDVRTFRLVSDAGGELPFTYQPGQYLNLALTIAGKRVNRSYTIASSPTRGHYCELTVKRSVTGHGSLHLHDAIRQGSRLKVSAPAGRFIFTGAEAAVDAVVLIAGGVGITPLMSIIRYLTDRCWPGAIYLLFSVRKMSDLIFREELAYLERRFPNLHVCATLSKEDAAEWTGARGVITKDLLTRFVPRLRGVPVYLCGPEGMMAAMRTLLAELGVSDADVKTEAFVSPPAVSAAPAGANVAAALDETSVLEAPPTVSNGEKAWVRFERSNQLVALSADKTILEMAEDSGVDIPFECRSGICGQCKTRLVAGQVTMDTEDALSAVEKTRGLILACQARALGNVTVDV
jgi:ferredoxin-NADP reductase/DMSO/TMAO reductase YedYZ heme-binding membrane subunit